MGRALWIIAFLKLPDEKIFDFPLALCLNFAVCQEAGHLGNICEIYVYAASLAPGKRIFFFPSVL